MNCPFCYSILDKIQNPVIVNYKDPLGQVKAACGNCPYCKHYAGIHYTSIYYNERGVVKTQMELTMFGEELPTGRYNDRRFRIEHFINGNITDISTYCGKGKWQSILQLETNAIKPSNAQDKLLLYLILS